MYRWRWWKPSPPPPLPRRIQIPHSKKLHKGCRLLALTSTRRERGGEGTMREHRFRYGNGGSPSQRISLERNASLFFPAVLRPTQAQMPSVSPLNPRLQSRTLPGLKGPEPCKPALAPASPSPRSQEKPERSRGVTLRPLETPSAAYSPPPKPPLHTNLQF